MIMDQEREKILIHVHLLPRKPPHRHKHWRETLIERIVDGYWERLGPQVSCVRPLEVSAFTRSQQRQMACQKVCCGVKGCTINKVDRRIRPTFGAGAGHSSQYCPARGKNYT